MILLRVLNKYDIITDPLINGIASKEMMYELASKNVNGNIEEYLNSNIYNLEKIFLKKSNKTRNDVLEYRKFINCLKDKDINEITEIISNNEDNIPFGSYITFMKYLSSLQSHLLFGSTKTTDWISTSTSIESIDRYYNKQKIHKVAVIKSDTGGLVDSDNILSVDLSTFESIIKNNKYLCNSLDIKDEKTIDVLTSLSTLSPALMINFMENMINPTKINSRGFKYSTNSKEVCILKYIPKSHIVSVLEAIQIDIAKKKRFNTNYLNNPKKIQELELMHLKKRLLEKIKELNDNYLLYLYDELYIKNKNIKELVSFNQSEEYIKNNQNKILKLALDIPSPMIKKY